ncbi:MAG: YbhB/YbcL family Raf kinase inhibitor-like protein [Elainellaceae cyanobacterium]
MVMTRRRFFKSARLACATLGLALAGCRLLRPELPDPLQQPGVGTMAIASAAFGPNELISVEYTCDGEDISPPLSWQGVPAAAESLVIIVDDPDAPGGTFVHWVLYNLSADELALPAAVPPAAELEQGRRQGKNDFGNLGYGGPCPPRGTHRYRFKVYALEQPLTLEAGATKRQVIEAMSEHVLAGGELVGRYGRG